MAGGGKGSAGWAIVALALAVPGLMFYMWWSHLNNASRQQMTQRVRKRLPGGASLFEGSPAQGKLTNPIAGEAQASTGAVAGEAPAAAPAPQAAQAAAPASAGASANPLPPPPVPLAPGETLPPPERAASSSPPSPAPAMRDPTLSPYDAVRIEQAAMEASESRREVSQAARQIRHREPPIESSIELQGIITDSDGRHRAIVNGEMVREGDSVGPARIARITPRGVVFIHKNRRFTKTMSQ